MYYILSVTHLTQRRRIRHGVVDINASVFNLPQRTIYRLERKKQINFFSKKKRRLTKLNWGLNYLSRIKMAKRGTYSVVTDFLVVTTQLPCCFFRDYYRDVFGFPCFTNQICLLTEATEPYRDSRLQWVYP